MRLDADPAQLRIIDDLPRLSRTTMAAERIPPIRIVHLGLGAFHRAHQAWYTDVVDEKREWGIAAFTGRDPAAAVLLREQDGLFTVIERSAEGDSARVVASIVEADDGADLDRLTALLASPDVVIVTITITEAGYRLRPDGRLDLDDRDVAADIAALASDRPTVTPLGRLLAGLRARRAAGLGGLSVVPCDNLPANGDAVRGAVLELARRVDADLATWVATGISFVSTSVDRITPHVTHADLDAASRLTGFRDEAAVATEPFHDWVLSGAFPAGRPAWERAGARFVDDIEPFEHRKLWLLNGAHSLLAYEGLLAGFTTVAEAIGDASLLFEVERFWDDATRHLPAELDIDDYRLRLLERFRNPRIEHRLVQVGADGVTKLRLRMVPIIVAERSTGRPASAAIGAIGSWIALRIQGIDLADSAGEAVAVAAGGSDPTLGLLRLVDHRLADDPGVLREIRRTVARYVPDAGR